MLSIYLRFGGWGADTISLNSSAVHNYLYDYTYVTNAWTACLPSLTGSISPPPSFSCPSASRCTLEILRYTISSSHCIGWCPNKFRKSPLMLQCRWTVLEFFLTPSPPREFIPLFRFLQFSEKMFITDLSLAGTSYYTSPTQWYWLHYISDQIMPWSTLSKWQLVMWWWPWQW